MKTELVGVGLVSILAGIYLGMVEIAIMIGTAMILINYKPKPKKKPSRNNEEETILHPVVYEDAGDPPYLYPEKGKIKVYPNGVEKKVTAENMVDSAGVLVKGVTKGLTKLLK